MDTREKILKSAFELFLSEGFTVSTSKITKNAGVSAGILFYYFPTKNDLIYEICEQCLLDNYRAIAGIWANFSEADYPRFQEIFKKSWEVGIDWGLNNWSRSQYLHLYQASYIAGLFKSDPDKASDQIREPYRALIDVFKVAVENHLIKGGPESYNIEISRSVMARTIEFLHDFPQYRRDAAFMDLSWKTYWATVSVDSDSD